MRTSVKVFILAALLSNTAACDMAAEDANLEDDDANLEDDEGLDGVNLGEELVGDGVDSALGPVAAVSCYGGRTAYTVDNYDTLGTFVTSTRCRDINARVTWQTPAAANAVIHGRVCFVDRGYCNNWKFIPNNDPGEPFPIGEWVAIATDVLDGTRFNAEVTIGTSLNAYATVELAY